MESAVITKSPRRLPPSQRVRRFLTGLRGGAVIYTPGAGLKIYDHAGLHNKKFIMNKFIFYLLSFTWGLPVTLAGCLTALVFRICGARPERAGYCFRFSLGRGWGGFSLGVFIFTDKNANSHVIWHEHGHGVQNCVYGFFMPFIVSLPSAVRYWYRRLKKDKSALGPYEDIWFESQATRTGMRQRYYIAIRNRNR